MEPLALFGGWKGRGSTALAALVPSRCRWHCADRKLPGQYLHKSSQKVAKIPQKRCPGRRAPALCALSRQPGSGTPYTRAHHGNLA